MLCSGSVSLRGMEYSDDRKTMEEWAPLMMAGRKETERLEGWSKDWAPANLRSSNLLGARSRGCPMAQMSISASSPRSEGPGEEMRKLDHLPLVARSSRKPSWRWGAKSSSERLCCSAVRIQPRAPVGKVWAWKLPAGRIFIRMSH